MPLLYPKGCSYENSFPAVFTFNPKREKISFPRVDIRNISPTEPYLFWQTARWENIYRNPIPKMRDINLEKKGSVLLYLNVTGLDTLILFLVGVQYLY